MILFPVRTFTVAGLRLKSRKSCQCQRWQGGSGFLKERCLLSTSVHNKDVIFPPHSHFTPLPVHFVSSPKIPRHFRGFSGNRNWQLVLTPRLAVTVMGLRLDSVPVHVWFSCAVLSTCRPRNPPRKNKRQTGDSVWLASWHHLCLLLFYQL